MGRWNRTHQYRLIGLHIKESQISTWCSMKRSSSQMMHITLMRYWWIFKNSKALYYVVITELRLERCMFTECKLMAIAKESTQTLWLDFKCRLKAWLKSWCSGRYYWERTFKGGAWRKVLMSLGACSWRVLWNSSPLFLLTSWLWRLFGSTHARLCHDVLSWHRLKSWSQLIMDHKTDQNKSFPCISWFDQVMCYSFRKLANSSALPDVGIGSFCTRWGPVPLSIPENQCTKFPVSEVELESIWKKRLSFLSSENSPSPTVSWEFATKGTRSDIFV